MSASGTEIIARLGEEHLRTGKLIVYTSADSVFQIAAHEALIPIEEQYRICEIARDLLRGEHEVGRVIARPFIGEPGAFTRTANRHDYAVPPPPGMLLDRLAERGVPVHGIGKIADVFLNRGITSSVKTKSNAEAWRGCLKPCARQKRTGFANFVDFDMLYGTETMWPVTQGRSRPWMRATRGDGNPARRGLADLLRGSRLRPDDRPPTIAVSTHFARYRPGSARGGNLDTRDARDIGHTVAHNFDTNIPHGESFLEAIS